MFAGMIVAKAHTHLHTPSCHAEAFIPTTWTYTPWSNTHTHTHLFGRQTQTENLLNGGVVWVSPPTAEREERARIQTSTLRQSCRTSWCSCSRGHIQTCTQHTINLRLSCTPAHIHGQTNALKKQDRYGSMRRARSSECSGWLWAEWWRIELMSLMIVG